MIKYIEGEQVGGGGVECKGGWEAKGGLYHPLKQEQSCNVFNKAQKQPQSTHVLHVFIQDSHWQQFDTACDLISVLQLHRIFCSEPS